MEAGKKTKKYGPWTSNPKGMATADFDETDGRLILTHLQAHYFTGPGGLPRSVHTKHLGWVQHAFSLAGDLAGRKKMSLVINNKALYGNPDAEANARARTYRFRSKIVEKMCNEKGLYMEYAGAGMIIRREPPAYMLEPPQNP